MSVRYLLPCPCGKKISVAVVQAGQEVRCECGNALTVPTMHGLRSLERVEVAESSGNTSAAWGVVIGTAVLGLVVLGVGGALLHQARGTQPEFVDIDQLPPFACWYIWQDLRTGVRVPEFSHNDYLEQKKVYHQNMAVAIGVLVVGGLIVAGAAIGGVATAVSRTRRGNPGSP